jgi:hypothetical protein
MEEPDFCSSSSVVRARQAEQSKQEQQEACSFVFSTKELLPY